MEGALPRVRLFGGLDERANALARSAVKSCVAALAGALLTNPLDVVRNEMFKTDLSLVATVRRPRAHRFSLSRTHAPTNAHARAHAHAHTHDLRPARALVTALCGTAAGAPRARARGASSAGAARRSALACARARQEYCGERRARRRDHLSDRRLRKLVARPRSRRRCRRASGSGGTAATNPCAHRRRNRSCHRRRRGGIGCHGRTRVWFNRSCCTP